MRALLKQMSEDDAGRAELPRHFLLFLTGSGLSNVGTWMQMVAQSWLVAELSHEPFWSGFVGFCAGVPMLLLSLVGGTLADRMPRRKLLVVSQLMMMFVAAVLGTLTLLHVVKIWHVAVLAFLTGVGSAISTPAYHGFLFDIVGRERLGKAVSLNAAQLHLSRTIGPGLAGLLLGFIGAGGCFILNAVSFLAVIPLIFVVPILVTQDYSRAKNESFFTAVKEALSYVWAQKAIRITLMALCLVSVLIMPHITLLALYVKAYLHLDPHVLGWLWVSSGLGSVIIAIMASRIPDFTSRMNVRTILFAACASGMALFLFASAKSLFWMHPLIFITGACVGLVSVCSLTLMQSSVRPELRGRILGLWGTLFQGMFPIGNMVVGTLAQFTSIPFAWKVTGGLMAAISLVSVMTLATVAPSRARS